MRQRTSRLPDLQIPAFPLHLKILVHGPATPPKERLPSSHEITSQCRVSTAAHTHIRISTQCLFAGSRREIAPKTTSDLLLVLRTRSLFPDPAVYPFEKGPDLLSSLHIWAFSFLQSNMLVISGVLSRRIDTQSSLSMTSTFFLLAYRS